MVGGLRAPIGATSAANALKIDDYSLSGRLADLPGRSVRVLSERGPWDEAAMPFTPRLAQQELAEAIAQAVSTRSVLVAEAGTGTGKTFAYLVPLLLSGQRVVISTGTRYLQDQLYERDLPALQRVLGLTVRSALLKGRANYVCRHRLTRHLADGRFATAAIGAGLRRIQRFAALSDTGDRSACTELEESDPAWAWATSTRDNCLGQECPEIKDCFVYRARRAAQQADWVVVNHHLFGADLALREDAMAELLPRADVVVLDEAHQLPDVLSEFLGESFTTRQCHDLARDVMAAGGLRAPDGAPWWSLAGQLEEAAEHLVLGVHGISNGALSVRGRPGAGRIPRLTAEQLMNGLEWPSVVDRVASALVAIAVAVATNAGRDPELDRCGVRAENLLERLQVWWHALNKNGSVSCESSSIAGALVVSGTSQGCDGQDTAVDSVVWAECLGREVALRRTPLSASAALTRCRDPGRQTWVFVSATLTVAGDFGHFVRALGLQDASCRRWDSPFDFARQAALWVPRGLGPPTAPDFSEKVLDAVWPLLCANRGRAFFLCTTVRATRVIASRLRQRNAEEGVGLTCLVQGDAPRQHLLARFRTTSAAVLVGSAGFWEGVDVAGDALSLVVIDKLPFAPPDDPVVQARCEAVRRAGGDPFMAEQVPAAALALQQGVGRLIRSEHDRGVMVVCDERLLTRSYGTRLLASLPAFTRVDDWRAAGSFLPSNDSR